jgi:hypothetical protein
LWGFSQWEQLCTSRDMEAQINFGDITPYLTYAYMEFIQDTKALSVLIDCLLASAALYILHREKKDSSWLCWSPRQRKCCDFLRRPRCNKKLTKTILLRELYWPNLLGWRQKCTEGTEDAKNVLCLSRDRLHLKWQKEFCRPESLSWRWHWYQFPPILVAIRRYL